MRKGGLHAGGLKRITCCSLLCRSYCVNMRYTLSCKVGELMCHGRISSVERPNDPELISIRLQIYCVWSHCWNLRLISPWYVPPKMSTAIYWSSAHHYIVMMFKSINYDFDCPWNALSCCLLLICDNTKCSVSRIHFKALLHFFEGFEFWISCLSVCVSFETKHTSLQRHTCIHVMLYRSLNRIQSKIFPAAYRSNVNLLVCAPTGAGKTNIAMTAVLHEVS